MSDYDLQNSRGGNTVSKTGQINLIRVEMPCPRYIPTFTVKGQEDRLVLERVSKDQLTPRLQHVIQCRLPPRPS